MNPFEGWRSCNWRCGWATSSYDKEKRRWWPLHLHHHLHNSQPFFQRLLLLLLFTSTHSLTLFQQLHLFPPLSLPHPKNPSIFKQTSNLLLLLLHLSKMPLLLMLPTNLSLLPMMGSPWLYQLFSSLLSLAYLLSLLGYNRHFLITFLFFFYIINYYF